MVSTDNTTEGTENSSSPSEDSIPHQPPSPGQIILITSSDSDDEPNSPIPPPKTQKIKRQQQKERFLRPSTDRSAFGDRRKRGRGNDEIPTKKIKKVQQCEEQKQNVTEIVNISKSKKEAQNQIVAQIATSSKNKKREQKQSVAELATVSIDKKEAQKQSAVVSTSTRKAKKEGNSCKGKKKIDVEEVEEEAYEVTKEDEQGEQEEDMQTSIYQFCEERNAAIMEVKNAIQKIFNDTVSEVRAMLEASLHEH
jgi:hypothetical protein